MATPRSLIEQAVLDCFDDTVSPRCTAREAMELAMRTIRIAMVDQLREEAVQRDHRYRQAAREDVVPNAVLVEPNAKVVHGVEFGGLKGAWVDAKVFVMARTVEDE